ncbi:MAG: type II secretion system F family protein [Candidatus Sumerlaeia bacterium]|nr:type II secretion system F family protein [Candidatus Sumerlaeia bacterium]
MPEFFYEALDKGGKHFKGVISAPNEDIIIEKLRGMGYYPLKVKMHKKKATEIDLFALPGIRAIAHRIKLKHLVTFTRQLATLIDAGLPILRSLYILQEQVESVVFKDKISQIAKDIESGSSLSDALAKHPKVFDKLYVNMVRAGEIGGVLESILNKIAEFLEKRQALRSKVRSAMMYPMTVLILATLIVTFILIKIIPKFREIFEQLGAKELPKITEILIKASWILAHRAYIVVGGIIVLYLIYRKLNKTRSGKFVFDSIKLKLPVFGDLLLKIAIQRFAGTLSTLITAGVPILQSLDIVRETSGNEVIARAMEKVYQSVKDGETIHEPLRDAKVFPPLVYHMVAVGEETGAIDQMLTKVAEAYEREVDDTVNALASILEPLMIVCLGGLVGFIVIALYMPLFTIPKILGKES